MEGKETNIQALYVRHWYTVSKECLATHGPYHSPPTNTLGIRKNLMDIAQRVFRFQDGIAGLWNCSQLVSSILAI